MHETVLVQMTGIQLHKLPDIYEALDRITKGRKMTSGVSEITFRQAHSESKRVYVDGIYVGVVVYLTDSWWALDKNEDTLGNAATKIGAARILRDAFEEFVESVEVSA